ncbi:MAG: TatD family hydrolase [Patescibacteria group bacterium]
MIDSHCHLNFKAFKNDWRKVLKRSFEHGITNIINIGSNYKTSERAVDIAKEFSQCYAAVGFHPIHIDDERFDPQKYSSLIRANSRIVKAIGETGFDYFYNEISKPQFKNKNYKEIQKNIFLEHLRLAKEFKLPVILHCRGEVNNPFGAYEDLLSVINSLLFLPKGVIHCFSANWSIAKKFLDLGFYIGFTGIITFKNCNDYLLEVVKKAPLEKILIETDAPYLAPEPYRGQRCEPWHVKFTAQKIAEIKRIDLEKVIKQTIKNAKNLFKI